MTSPPAGAQKPRRNLVWVLAGIAIVAVGAIVALFVPIEFRERGLVETGRDPQRRNVVLTERFDGEFELNETSTWRKPAEVIPLEMDTSSGSSGDPDGELSTIPDIQTAKPPPVLNNQDNGQDDGKMASVDPDFGDIHLPWPREHLVLSVTYPGAVTVGDSIRITINISSQTLTEVRNGNIELTLDAPSLEWGDGRKRIIAQGEPLPVDVNFSAGTKATGLAAIVILAKAPDPIALFTAAGPNLETKESSMAPDGAALDSSAQTPKEALLDSKAAAARLTLDTTIDVDILTKYALSDTTVHWVGIGGWVVSALGAGTMLKGIGSFLWNRRRKHVPDPLP